ncbi:hypothetical protein Tco_0814572 [Tanacetum coccineum]
MVKNLDNAGKFLMYPMFVQVFLDNQLEEIEPHNRTYIALSYTKNIFANMRRQGKDFSGRVTPLFPTMVVQAQEEMGEGLAIPTDHHHTPMITQPSSSQPQRKQKSRRPKTKDSEIPQSSGRTTDVVDEAVYKERDDRTSSDGGPRRQETMRDTIAQTRVLDLENTKTAQAQEITSLKLRIKSLGDPGDCIQTMMEEILTNDIDKDAGLHWLMKLRGRREKFVEEFQQIDVTDVVTIPVSAAIITNVELTLAQTLAELKSARPKTKGVVMQEPSDIKLLITIFSTTITG